jgi:hypothetical protein
MIKYTSVFDFQNRKSIENKNDNKSELTIILIFPKRKLYLASMGSPHFLFARKKENNEWVKLEIFSPEGVGDQFDEETHV